MWYTKNFIKTAQLTIIPVPADDAKNDKKIERYNHYVNAINKNIENITYLKNLYKHINLEPDNRFDENNGKTQLKETLSNLIKAKAGQTETQSAAGAAGAQGTTNTPGALNIENIKTTISNFLISKNIQSHDPSVTFSEGNYFVNLKLQTNQSGAPILPYGFNFKTQEELTARLNSVAEYLNRPITQQNGQPSQNLSQKQQENAGNQTQNGLGQQSPNKPNQKLVLLSPVSNGVVQLQLPGEVANQYNEARNSGSIAKFEVTKNQNGTNQIAVKEASQYYTEHPKLLEAIRLFLEKNGEFQFATNDQGNVIPGEYTIFTEGGIKPANYQPAKLNILVPGAADKAPVDLFLDGQKIATVYNNTDFTFDTTKYPLLEGKHVLEAKAEKVPSLTPIQDKFLKTLSKNRSYYFNIEEGKMPNLTTSTNDLSTYKAADSESYGSGLAVKLRENPYRSTERDLQENNVVLHPAFKYYYTVKARLTDDPELRKQAYKRAIYLQNEVKDIDANDDEFEYYVEEILKFENSGQLADDNTTAVFRKNIFYQEYIKSQPQKP